MLYIVMFTDRPDSAALRQKWLAPHLEWLRAQPAIRQAGSLRETPESSPVGGCWMVDAPNKATVEALVKADPFSINGVRETARVLQWSIVFPERL